MTDLRVRIDAEEQMDAIELDAATYAAILRDLAKVNRLTFSARPTLGFLRRIAQHQRSISVLDVGFGAGDMLRSIARWGAANRIDLLLVGIDLNARSAPVATAMTPPRMAIDYRTGDYRDLAGEGFDVVLSSFVTHHMRDPELIDFLRFMEAEAAAGWLVNDLRRSAFAHRGFPLLARVMGWHRIVREDGTLSIARSFREEDWGRLLAAAQIDAAQVVRRWPFRLCVERIR
jgi:2-polyprenyl-3-methyl-5-hydroxy-6-metoxy-1,4-benzoquinol methylase